MATALAVLAPLACSDGTGSARDAATTTTATTPDGAGPAGTTPPATPTPLPTGMSVAYAAPGDVVEAGHGPGFATQAVATVDRHGQPVLVWGTFTDATGRASVVQTARYDAASGAWTKPVDLFSGRVGHDGAGRSIAATTDPTTGAIHVVWSQSGDEPGPPRTISLATSTDDGRTWSTQRVAEEAGLATPSVAAADDVVHVTWWSERDGVVRAVGAPPPEGTAERRWERSVAPVPAGFVPLATAPAVAVDPTGAPVVAFATTTPSGSVGRVLVWRPDRAAAATAVADVTPTEPPAVALAMHGDAPVVALTGTDVRAPSASPTSGTPGTPLPSATTTPTSAAPSGGGTARNDASPWAWVVRTSPTGAPTAPVALEAGPAGRRTDDVPLPPGIGLVVLPDGTAAVALVPVVASTTCVVAREGADGQSRDRIACSRGVGDDQPQVIPSGRAPSLVRLGDGRLAVPLGNSEAAPGLPIGLTLWTSTA